MNRCSKKQDERKEEKMRKNVWKRCLAFILSAVVVLTSVDMSAFAASGSVEGNVWSAKAGEIVAASIIIGANGYLNYHLSGSKGEFRNLAPSNLMLYEIALWGSANGYRSFHMGGGVGSKEDNLYVFKKGFGGEVVELIGEYDFVVRPGYYLLYDVSYKVVHALKKLKTKLHL